MSHCFHEGLLEVDEIHGVSHPLSLTLVQLLNPLLLLIWCGCHGVMGGISKTLRSVDANINYIGL